MTGGHHGSFAGRFFQVAGLGRVAGAGAGLGVPPLGGGDAAPPEGGTPCETGAVGRAPSPSVGEGWGEGEDVRALVGAEAPEVGGRSPSPRPSAAGRGGALAAVGVLPAFSFSAGVKSPRNHFNTNGSEGTFSLSAGAKTAVLTGTGTAMVGLGIVTSARGGGRVTDASGARIEGLTVVEASVAGLETSFAGGGMGRAAVEIGCAAPGIVSAGVELARAGLEMGCAAVEMTSATGEMGGAAAAEGLSAAAGAVPTGATGFSTGAGPFPAAVGAFPAGAGGLPTASARWGARSLPSAGFSLGDFGWRSSMAMG